MPTPIGRGIRYRVYLGGQVTVDCDLGTGHSRLSAIVTFVTESGRHLNCPQRLLFGLWRDRSPFGSLVHWHRTTDSDRENAMFSVGLREFVEGDAVLEVEREDSVRAQPCPPGDFGLPAKASAPSNEFRLACVRCLPLAICCESPYAV
jgi:hypothetical protein